MLDSGWAVNRERECETDTEKGETAARRGEPRKRSVRVMACAAALVLASLLGAPHTALAETTDEQKFRLIFTADPSEQPGKVIAHGPIEGLGSVEVTQRSDGVLLSTYEFVGGTLSIAATPISGSFEPDFRSCTARATSVSQVNVTGGTGSFAGATGTGLARSRAFLVGQRGPSGECLLSERPPARGVEVVDVDASIDLPR